MKVKYIVKLLQFLQYFIFETNVLQLFIFENRNKITVVLAKILSK